MTSPFSLRYVKTRLTEKSFLSVILWMLILHAGYSVTAGILMRCPAQDVLLNLFFQFFLMTLPGLAVTSVFYHDQHDPVLTATMSYAWGYVIIILEYLVAMPLGRGFLLPVALLVSALSCVALWKNRTEIMTPYPEQKIHAAYLLVFAAVVIVAFLAYSAKNGGAWMANSTFIVTDNAFWLNNTSALSVSFPPANPRLSGTVIKYYYFSNIPIAFQSNALGMSGYSVGTVYYAFPKSLLLFGGVYAVLNSLRLSKKSILFGLIAIIFSTGIEAINVVNNTSHLMAVPFGYDIGIGCCCWTLYFVIKQYHSKDFRYELCIGAVTFMAAAYGTKAPSALLFMIAAGIICFGWLFGKEYKKAFSYGIGLLAAFAIIMMVFVNDPTPGNSTRIGGFTPSQLLNYSELPSFIYSNFISKMFPSFLAYPSMVFLFLMADPLPFFFSTVGILQIIKRKKARSPLYLGFAISITIGMFMGLFWCHFGKSNMYYSMAARILAILFGMCLFDREISKAKPVPSRSIAGLISVTLCMQVFLFFFVGFDDGCLINMCKGAKKIYTLYSHSDSSRPIDSEKISHDTVEALDWIRTNTEKDSIIATDDSVSENPDPLKAKYMYSSIFSERIIYMEGYIYFHYEETIKEVSRRNNLLLNMYHNDTDSLIQLGKEDVDYILCHHSSFPDFNPDEEYAEKVYSNDSADVYRIISH